MLGLFLWRFTLNSHQKSIFRRSKEWKLFRLELLNQRGSVCQCCGVKKKNGLQIHHLNPADYEALIPEDFSILCSTCHDIVELLFKRVRAKKKTLVREELWLALFGEFLPKN